MQSIVLLPYLAINISESQKSKSILGAAHLPGGHAGWRDRPKTLPTPNCTYTKVININKINVLIRIDKINVPNPKLNMSAMPEDGATKMCLSFVQTNCKR